MEKIKELLENKKIKELVVSAYKERQQFKQNFKEERELRRMLFQIGFALELENKSVDIVFNRETQTCWAGIIGSKDGYYVTVCYKCFSEKTCRACYQVEEDN